MVLYEIKGKIFTKKKRNQIEIPAVYPVTLVIFTTVVNIMQVNGALPHL